MDIFPELVFLFLKPDLACFFYLSGYPAIRSSGFLPLELGSYRRYDNLPRALHSLLPPIFDAVSMLFQRRQRIRLDLIRGVRSMKRASGSRRAGVNQETLAKTSDFAATDASHSS